jgi:hypothetical protein
MVTAAGSPEKESYVLVLFRYGDPNVVQFSRYTDWQMDFEGHVSTPAMGIEFPENAGTFDEKELRILMPIDSFTSAVGSGAPHSPIFVQIEEITAGLFAGDAGTRRIIFKGRVTRTIKNFQGRNDTVAFFALPAKSRIDVPMGLQCNHHCINRLFSPGCGLIQANFEQLGEIAVMDGKEITISTPNSTLTAPVAPGGDNSRFWERGFLEKDGLKIGVHIWTIADPTVFVLRRRPPNTWLLAGGNSIKFVPGCHKTIEDCRDVWDNEQGQAGSGGFAGFGYAMLPYNPMYESPQ